MKVEIRDEARSTGPTGRYDLLGTRNGYQWSGMSSLSLDELKVIKQELDKFLDGKNHG